MKNLSKKFLSILMAVAMVVTMLPLSGIITYAATSVTERYVAGRYLTNDVKTGIATNSNVVWDTNKNAAYFDGTGYLKLSGTPLSSVNSSSGFAVSFDIMFDSSPNNWGRVLDFNNGEEGSTGSAKYFFVNGRQWGNDLNVEMKNGEQHGVGPSGETISDSTFRNVIVIYDGDSSETQIWIENNGTYSNVAPDAGKNNITASDVNQFSTFTNYWIGKSSYGADPFFKGYVRNMYLFKGNLSRDRIASIVASDPDNYSNSTDGSSASFLTSEASLSARGVTNSGVTWDSTKQAARFNSSESDKLTINYNPIQNTSIAKGFAFSLEVSIDDVNTGTSPNGTIFSMGSSTKYFEMNANSGNNWQRGALVYKNNYSNQSVGGIWTNDFSGGNYESGGAAWQPTNGTFHKIVVIYADNDNDANSDPQLEYWVDGVLKGKTKEGYAIDGFGVGDIDTIVRSCTSLNFGVGTNSGSSVGDNHGGTFGGYFNGYLRNVRFYDNVSDIDGLRAAMSTYECAMDGTVYSDMQTAYDAYVVASRYYDANKFGGDTSADYATAAQNLIKGTAKMVKYAKPEATAVQSYQANTADSGVDRAATNSVNIISANRNSTSGQTTAASQEVANCSTKVFYGETVLLYDGVTQPRFPVTFSCVRTSDKTRYVHTIYPASSDGSKSSSANASTDFDLHHDKGGGHDNCWYGSDTNNTRIDYGYNYTLTEKVGGNATNSDNHWSAKLNNSTTHYYVNAARYIGTPDAAIKDFQIKWSQRSSSNEQVSGSSITNDDYGTMTSSVHTYVYNYAGINSRLSAKASYLGNVRNYREGGLSTLLGYCDSLSQSPDSMTSDVAAANSAYSAITSATPTADSGAYETIRQALGSGATKKLGSHGVVTGNEVISDSTLNATTLTNYATFSQNYSALRGAMADLKNYGYGENTSGSVASALGPSFLNDFYNMESLSQAAAPTISQFSNQNYLNIGSEITIASSESVISGTVTYKIFYDVNNTNGNPDATGTFAYGASANVAIFPNNSHNKAIVTAVGNDEDGATNIVSRTFYRIMPPSFSGMYDGGSLVSIPADRIVDRDVSVQAVKNATNDDASITLQYSYNGGESWNDDGNSGQIDALYHDGAYASVGTVTIRSVVKSGGNVIVYSENTSITLAREADFGIYIESAGSTAKFYDADNTGADKIIIYDTSNYSDDIVYTLVADGVAVSGTGEDTAGVFTYDKTNGIDLTGNSKAAEAINGADYVTINAYSRDVKSGNYDTYESATFYNKGNFDSFIYHESFNGSVSDGTYVTNDSKGVNILTGDTNSAGTTLTVPEKAGDKQGFAKSETGTSADMRKNVLKISGTNQHINNGGKEAFAKLSSNPLANDLAKVYAKENGVTISFWRAMQNGTDTKANIPSDDKLRRDAIAFRRQNPQDQRDYFMIELTGNMSYAESVGDYFDIVPGEYDVTQNSLSKYSGYWQHIAVTINPKAASVEEAINVYIDGIPHPASTSYSQNYDIPTAIDASGGDYAAATDTVEKTIGDLLDMITDSTVDLCLAHDNQWQGHSDDIYLDDIRIYTDVLTQQDIWETYYDEYSDTPTLEGNRASVTHDPTTITVYKLKAASNGMAAGSLVGQEFIDYYSVPSSNYDVEYYSYGTGLQIYHSTDNVNWEIVGDKEGRVAYQSHDQFVKDNGNGTWSSLEYHTALSEVLTSIRNASDYNNSQKGAGHLVWAPHVSYNLTTNKWMMYVAISCWSGATSAIISMESADGTPEHFVARDSSNNQAYSVIVKSSGRPNAIDACTYYKYDNNGRIDPSTLYMAYGAWSQGEAKTEDLCTMQLNANGTAKYGASGIITYSGAMSAEDGTRICASQPSEPDGVTGEGAFITYNNGYYYLYVAYGVNDYNYVTRVFRATSPTGPFVDYNGVQATNSSAVHGTQIMAPHYVKGDNYIYMSTGHDSIYKAVNENGEMINIHSAHARPVSNEANNYKELPDYAMVTRQIALAGNVTITHAMFYTQSGWAISMPEQYNGTDTSTAITASQIDGKYSATTLHDIIDEGLTYSAKAKPSGYSTNWDFGEYIYFSHEDETSGIIYGDGQNGFMNLDFTYELSYDDPVAKTTTYITIKDGSGTTVAEGVVAMHDETPELSYFNISEVDLETGVPTRASSTIWAVKQSDLPASADFNALDSAYAQGDALLKGLDGKAAQYNAASVQALIDALETAKPNSTKSNAKKRLVPASSQTSINDEADDITDAIEGLTPLDADIPAEDFSTYEAAVSAINNVDPDAYEEVVDEGEDVGHMESAISTANDLVSDSTKTYETSYIINVVDSTATQQRVGLATTAILNALTYCTKKYAIRGDAGVASIEGNKGEYKDGYATYGTIITFRAASEETAWNLEVTSRTSHKKPAFYGYGKSISVKTTGALNAATETRAANEKKVKIIRHYDNSTNEKAPVQFAEFVSAGPYTLPAAPAIAFYTFDGYYIGETKILGETTEITDDTEIIAKYNYDASANYAINATALTGGTGCTDSVAYNTRIELKGGSGAYGWSVDLGNGQYRPFCVGADVAFYAMESLNLVAETESTFKAHGYSLPAVHLRDGGVINVDGKKTFNAQIVADDFDNVKECGILVAVANGKQPGTAETVDPVTPEDFQIIVENAGQQMGYAVLRAKSTKFVGANQIAIAVNSLPSGYVYRAYVTFVNSKGVLETIYTDVVRPA